MKTVLFIFLLFLFSCEKPTEEPIEVDPMCWACRVTTTKYFGSNPTPISKETKIIEPCGIEAIKIFDYQDENYKKETKAINGQVITTVIEYDCKSK